MTDNTSHIEGSSDDELSLGTRMIVVGCALTVILALCGLIIGILYFVWDYFLGDYLQYHDIEKTKLAKVILSKPDNPIMNTIELKNLECKDLQSYILNWEGKDRKSVV